MKMFGAFISVIVGMVVIAAVLAGFAAGQAQTERKTHRETITEEWYVSRSCPDDVVGEAPHNSWSIEVNGEHATATCSYLVYDEEKK